jgi:hypothetical protein
MTTLTLDGGVEPVLIELLDRLGRLRVLHDDESGILETLIRRDQRKSGSRQLHRWTRDEDRELLRLQYRRRGVADYAVSIGVSERAAWQRLDKLRYPKKRLARPDLVEG